MSFHKDQFKNLIENVLSDFNLDSPSAVQLLLGTAATESRFGHYLEQVNGPARGVFQMEPATEFDIWVNYLNYKSTIKAKIYTEYGIFDHLSGAMIWNLAYQIIMARLKYIMIRERLPHESDIEGMARYWKKYYNTPLGNGQVSDFISAYQRFCV